MTRDALRTLLRRQPLVASVQASPGSALEDPDTLLRLAQASLSQGVALLRLEGETSIRTIRAEINAPTIGLIKRRYEGSEVYVTPTEHEVDALLATGCEVVALDATQRARPGKKTLPELIARIRRAGRLVMADCDTLAAALAAEAAGADVLSTTLSGYTPDSPPREGPDLAMLRALCERTTLPVLAEGRYAEPWEARAALCIGAAGVVIGGALNDPVKQTARFAQAMLPVSGPLAAVDLGGTWLRFGLFDENGVLGSVERTPTPATRTARRKWLRPRLTQSRARVVGVSSGGTLSPLTGTVLETKPLIPDHRGTSFPEDLAPARVYALNDGLASAWGHACHPRFAGLRVATLALGTGVGFGLVDRGRILMGSQGEYPRLNDLRSSTGRPFEERLGGGMLEGRWTEDARNAAEELLQTVASLYHPEVIVVCGGLGLSESFDPRDLPCAWARSPYGIDAGLYGAAALALYPPFAAQTP